MMMVRIPFGVPLWQEVLSLVLLYGTAIGMVWMAGRIYRVGILMYGKKPTVEAIHAGVECGLLSGKIEGLDCISMGPDMYDIHTTEERLSISSAKRSYEYILRVIACK